MNKRNKDMEVEDSLMIKNLSYELIHFQTSFYSTIGHVSIIFFTNENKYPSYSVLEHYNTISAHIAAASSGDGLGNKHKNTPASKINIDRKIESRKP